MNLNYASLMCYRKIKGNGVLSYRREQVWDALAEHSPCTAGELHKHMEDRGIKDTNHPHVNARLSELVNLGVARRLPDYRECRITGNTVNVFEFVDAMPNDWKPAVVVPAHQKIKELESLIELLREQVRGLEAENSRLKGKPQLSLF